MNKKHWNTVYCERDTIEETLIIQLIDHSYELVVSGLKKADQMALKNL
jgi:predicted DNA-binding protein (MmcQ/YjbR family)